MYVLNDKILAIGKLIFHFYICIQRTDGINGSKPVSHKGSLDNMLINIWIIDKLLLPLYIEFVT